ncbi:MAG: terminase family protein, partial [Bacilli bacterium]|nr:terminase family protein [Bacilli bacterium]
MKNNYFLPYQERWLNDKSKIKIWEKSRRIGATYVQSYEDVRDCVNKTVPAVWFSSADESAAKEYIDYCEQWVKLFHITAKRLGEVIIDNDKDIKAFVIQFSNGTKIHALSSNPKGFRSKGGKVVLDE